MVTDEELERLATDLESDLVERKESLRGSAKTKVGEAICAFANDLPGYRKAGIVFVGLTDNGEPSGLEITDQLLQDLGAFQRDGNILSPPSLNVQKRRVRGSDVAVVFVEPSADTPVRYDGRIWIRVGPRRSIASRDDERILTEKRQGRDLKFDEQPARGAGLADLDLRLFQEQYLPRAIAPDILEQNERTTAERLAALQLTSPSGVPTNAALLLIGHDPRRWLPGAYVQFVRFDGDDRTDPILDQKEIDGSLPRVIPDLDHLTALNIQIATEIGEHTYERRSPDYPIRAIQQLIRNALLHRSYEIDAPVYFYWFRSFVEIHSPGGLYGRINEQNFLAGLTDYRNRTLAQGLRILSFVQKFGAGLRIAHQQCQENGNPPPSFEFHPSAVFVRIHRRSP